MFIKTDIPLLKNDQAINASIAKFWNSISSAWRKIYGPHIHHGFYGKDKEVDPHKAQVVLIDEISKLIHWKPNMAVLDVGCGLGETALYLAKQHQVKVTGITLSESQCAMAKNLSQANSNLNLNFHVEDAHHLESIADNSQDLVWSLESCEQFYDKRLFLHQAHRVLKKGGQLMIATWCTDKPIYQGKLAKRYASICKEFLLPCMPTKEKYTEWLGNSFEVKNVLDWSSEVKNSWAIGMEGLRKYSWYQLWRWGGFEGLKFCLSLAKMKAAFMEGQLRYIVFIASKSTI